MNPTVITKIKAFLAGLTPEEYTVLKQHVDAGDFTAPLDLFEQSKAELKASLGLFTKVANLKLQLAAK